MKSSRGGFLKGCFVFDSEFSPFQMVFKLSRNCWNEAVASYFAALGGYLAGAHWRKTSTFHGENENIGSTHSTSKLQKDNWWISLQSDWLGKDFFKHSRHSTVSWIEVFFKAFLGWTKSHHWHLSDLESLLVDTSRKKSTQWFETKQKRRLQEKFTEPTVESFLGYEDFVAEKIENKMIAFFFLRCSPNLWEGEDLLANRCLPNPKIPRGFWGAEFH